MATINPTPVDGDFNTALFNFLISPGIEGYVPFVYADSQGIPTLGVGYALATGHIGQQDWNSIDTSFIASLLNLTSTQKEELDGKLEDAVATLNRVPGVTNPFPACRKVPESNYFYRLS